MPNQKQTVSNETEQSQVSPVLGVSFILFGFFLALYFTIYSPQLKRDEANTAVIDNADRYVREVFPGLSTKTSPPVREGQLAPPALLWRGDTSDIIAIIPYRKSGLVVSRKWWTVYAKTANGRFFRVEYTLLEDKDASVQGVARLEESGVEPVSEDRVKWLLLDRKLVDDYRKWFGEPPVQTVTDA